MNKVNVKQKPGADYVFLAVRAMPQTTQNIRESKGYF